MEHAEDDGFMTAEEGKPACSELSHTDVPLRRWTAPRDTAEEVLPAINPSASAVVRFSLCLSLATPIFVAPFSESELTPADYYARTMDQTDKRGARINTASERERAGAIIINCSGGGNRKSGAGRQIGRLGL